MTTDRENRNNIASVNFPPNRLLRSKFLPRLREAGDNGRSNHFACRDLRSSVLRDSCLTANWKNMHLLRESGTTHLWPFLPHKIVIFSENERKLISTIKPLYDKLQTYEFNFQCNVRYVIHLRHTFSYLRHPGLSGHELPSCSYSLCPFRTHAFPAS